MWKSKQLYTPSYTHFFFRQGVGRFTAGKSRQHHVRRGWVRRLAHAWTSCGRMWNFSRYGRGGQGREQVLGTVAMTTIVLRARAAPLHGCRGCRSGRWSAEHARSHERHAGRAKQCDRGCRWWQRKHAAAAAAFFMLCRAATQRKTGIATLLAGEDVMRLDMANAHSLSGTVFAKLCSAG